MTNVEIKLASVHAFSRRVAAQVLVEADFYKNIGDAPDTDQGSQERERSKEGVCRNSDTAKGEEKPCEGAIYKIQNQESTN